MIDFSRPSEDQDFPSRDVTIERGEQLMVRENGGHVGVVGLNDLGRRFAILVPPGGSQPAALIAVGEPDRQATFVINDRDGNPRIWGYLGEDGESRVMVLDASGLPVLAYGMVGLELEDTARGMIQLPPK